MRKDIIGYEGLYAVTDTGQIWSYKSKIFLKITSRGNGYYRANLYKNGIMKTASIHRLVAQAFLDNYSEELHVNHIDEDKSNNIASNLEMVTQKENNNYGTRITRAAAKISKEVICIDTNTIYQSIKEAARINDIDQGSISKVCNGKAKTCGGFRWCFMENKEVIANE